MYQRGHRVSTPWAVGHAQVSGCDPKAAAKVPALGLLQPLEALSLDADTLRRATAAAVAYCDAQGAGSVADLVERASTLITAAGLGSHQPHIALELVLSCPLSRSSAKSPHYPRHSLRPLCRMATDWPTECIFYLLYLSFDLRRNLLLPCRCDLLDGLMAALALKPVQAKRLLASLKGPAAAAQVCRACP